MVTQIIEQSIKLEEAMGTIVSHVPELAKRRGWAAMDLVRKGFSIQTAYKLLSGDPDFTMKTLILLCDVFEVNEVGEVITFVRDGQLGV